LHRTLNLVSHNLRESTFSNLTKVQTKECEGSRGVRGEARPGNMSPPRCLTVCRRLDSPPSE